MELKKSRNQGDTDIEIKEEGFDKYINTHSMDILDEFGIHIGEIKGYILNAKTISHDITNNNGMDSLYVLDALSELCSDAWSYLKYNKAFLMSNDNIYFLNRLSLNPPYATIENDKVALELLINNMGPVLYSFGTTELDDEFPVEPYDGYYDEHKSMLLSSGWKYNEETFLYSKTK